jgi:hypothetical protein
MPEYRDWSNREEELLVSQVYIGSREGEERRQAHRRGLLQNAGLEKSASTPKRLKQRGILATEELLRRHRKCNYRPLLDIHCPRKVCRFIIESTTRNLSLMLYK